jgi:hypothetical protein
MCSSKKCCCSKSKGIPIGFIILGMLAVIGYFAWMTIKPDIDSLLVTGLAIASCSVVAIFSYLVYVFKHDGIAVLHMGDPRDVRIETIRYERATTPTILGNPVPTDVAATSAPGLGEPTRPAIGPPSAVTVRLFPEGDIHHDDVIQQGRIW